MLANIATCCRCLADEADTNAHAHLVPPPLTALREFSVKLRAELQEVHTAVLLLISHQSSIPYETETCCSKCLGNLIGLITVHSIQQNQRVRPDANTLQI